MRLGSHPRLAGSFIVFTIAAVVLASVILYTSSLARASGGPTFTNPLNPSYGSDPWLLYYQGNYYLTTTEWELNQITMRKSPTIAGLATAPSIMLWSDPTAVHCCNDWAPEFHLLSGPNGLRWYIYFVAGTSGTSYSGQRIWVLESATTDPTGPYSFKGQLDPTGSNAWAIDPDVATINGQLYLVYSAIKNRYQNLFIAPLSNPWTASATGTSISAPTYSWESGGRPVNEGPEILQHNGQTFLIYSASFCGTADYKLGQLTLTGSNPLSASSWTKDPNPVFQRDDANGVYGPGHNGFFTSPDGTQSWIVYHANSSASQGCTDTRTTRVQQFTWNADGTPNFGTPVALGTPLAVPSGETSPTTVAVAGPTFELVNENSGRCLDMTARSTANGGRAQLYSCTGGTNQQWVLDDAADGYARLVNKNSSKVLDETNCAATDGTNIDQQPWLDNNCQEWQFTTTSDGWVQVTNHNSGKALNATNCGTTNGTNVDEQAIGATSCQNWRLQPVGKLALITQSAGKAVDVTNCVKTSGTALQEWEWLGNGCQQWSFQHVANGYYEVVSASSGLCLDVAGASTANGATIDEATCNATSLNQQWSIQSLNDGTFRFVAHHSGSVLDVANCGTADGTSLDQQSWLNNTCQRFRLLTP